MDSLKLEKILLATGNPGKLKEFKELTQDLPIEILGLKDLDIPAEAPETGHSFLENSLQKANWYHQKTGLPVLADDSGLEVDALNGEPGIYSARYGGFETHAERRVFLLKQLKGITPDKRTARFRCVAVFLDGNEPIIESGKVEGFIGLEERGDGGFGYDPLFSTVWDGPTFAQIPQEEKNRISHRGQAFKNLISRLRRERSFKKS